MLQSLPSELLCLLAKQNPSSHVDQVWTAEPFQEDRTLLARKVERQVMGIRHLEERIRRLVGNHFAEDNQPERL